MVQKGLTGNLVFHINRTKFRSWMDEHPDDALEALESIWTQDNVPVEQRIRDFGESFPWEVIGGSGTRTNLASVLLMGLNVEEYPPFRIKVFRKVCERTGYDPPERGANEAALYEHFLGFLRRFIDVTSSHNVPLRHLLDAQGLVWQFQNELPRLDAETVEPKSLDALADELLLSLEFLEEVCVLLEDKLQVIFQGPPGTGKTFIAQELAKQQAESGGRVTLVQFHPSYAYEDFVRGFRPKITESGQSGFSLQDGPLLRAAEKARGEPGAKHYLVIDEINRGNLAKVFGELYYLLEYRDEQIHMQYQEDHEEDFSLPENLYIIGTMNTADRSIALVDSALRRRFYFVEFHPDKDPVRSVLRNWLEQNKLEEMVWVADVVDEANKLLKNDKHAAIGPSYFMMEDLDEDDVRRIWKHSVLPYIEERLFGDDTRLEEFDLDKLKNKAAQILKD
ncbi:MAG: AAA family ATPase [Caldilineaceae bacterium]|nr:AAA family ATPase [Caldilineaceae bacterium]